ncbi:MAG TPA: hypothetical protein VMT46_07960 [Anaerolineaceae bacterium]|nr:hypothetical protein [Anaerolineaceae bacterium]
MDPSSARIQNAWRQASSWITENSGSANQAFLTNVPTGRLAFGIATLAAQTRNLRISAIPKGEVENIGVLDLASGDEAAAALGRKDTASVNVDYSISIDGMELDIHTIVERTPSGALDLNLVWWPDQAFPEDEDPHPRFDAILNFFIRLQDLFSAKRLYLGSDTPEKPAPGSIDWIEV